LLNTIITATVRQIVPYGLWLQYEDAAILVKIIDISWGRISSLEAMFKEGEAVPVKVTHQITDESYLKNSPLKRAGYPISTVWVGSIKELHPEQNPWREPFSFQVGQCCDGIVYSVTDFGVFVELVPNLEGLVLFTAENNSPRQPGDKCKVRIKEIDLPNQKLSLEFIEESGELS
jgi:small subunit ribosomal protein S1